MKASIILCTHNPRPDYLARVLESLRFQSCPSSEWELLVIDNASDVQLSHIVKLDWHAQARIVREDKLGLSYARQRGMREARSSLLIFADDDNVLDANYVAEAICIGEEWPKLGVWGGSIKPEFEVGPAAEVIPYLPLLALREVRRPRWTNVETCPDADPWGAGLCVRAGVAAAYVDHFATAGLKIVDRIGQHLSSCGDTEICYVACRNGLGMGIFPQLKVLHLIPKERLSQEYIVRIAEGVQTSALLLDYKWQGTAIPSLARPAALLRAVFGAIRSRGLARQVHLARLRAARMARTIVARSERLDRQIR